MNILTLTFLVCLFCTGCTGVLYIESYNQRSARNLTAVEVGRNIPGESAIQQPDSIPASVDSTDVRPKIRRDQYSSTQRHIRGAVVGLAIGAAGGALLGVVATTVLSNRDNSGEASAWGALLGGVVGGVIGLTYGAISGMDEPGESPQPDK